MQAIYLNGLQIHSNSSDVGFVVNIPLKGFEYPGVRINPYQKPGEHGAVVPNAFYDGRTIELTGRIYHPNINTYLQYRRALSNAMRLVQNSLNIAIPLALKMTTMDGLNLQANVYPSQQLQLIDKSLNHCDFIIDLFAPDPNLYDQSSQRATISVPTGGGATYPVIYPVTYAAKSGGALTVTNAGDSDTFPTVTFNGPLTSPLIVNQTTGASFQVNVTLLAGDVLVIDMANKTMLLNGSNAMKYFVVTNTWMSLQPGDNLIKLSSGISADSGNARFDYFNAYIGI